MVAAGGQPSVSGPVQRQVRVGPVGDAHERQADQVAGRISMGMNAPTIAAMNGGGNSTPTAQGKCKPCEEETVQRQETGAAAREEGRTLDGWADLAIRTRGPGEPLRPELRRTLEKRMGADLSVVRVHHDGAAMAAAAAIGARAFTHGAHIWLGKGESPDDVTLLAHEVTHTIQQGAVSQRGTGALPATGTAVAEPVVQRSLWDDITGVAGAVYDSTVGKVVDAAGAVVAAGADLFWSMISSLAPALVPILREISEKGIFGFLKEKIGDAFRALVNFASQDDGVLGTLFGAFAPLIGQVGEILGALMAGDCEPLFTALRTLKDAVSSLASDAWDAVTTFFQPAADFLSMLWSSFGAPAVEALSTLAGDVWEGIQDLGRQIWAWTEPVRDALSDAWSWVKDQLGFGGGEGNSEGGVIQWIKDQAVLAWEGLKEVLAPVIEPVEILVTKVKEILPMEAIFNLRETVTGWLGDVGTMANSLEEPDNVAAEQTGLREQILPAVLASIRSLRRGLIDTGEWVAGKIGGLAAMVSGFIGGLAANPYLSPVAGALQWVQNGVLGLATWAQSTVTGLFNLVGNALVYLSRFIEPILNALQKLAELVGDLLGKLPDFILGPVWWLLPDCIKNPIKDFVVNQILKRIPIFSSLLEIPDLWEKVKGTALTILKQIFVDGDLARAAWTFFSSMLNLVGIPPELVVGILARAAEAFGDIISNPIGFILNLFKALAGGFKGFFANIGKHLLNGVTGWLFGHLTAAGLVPPADFSFKSILGFVFDILGLSMDNIFDRLAKKTDPDTVMKIRGALETLTGAWEWVSLLIKSGPAAIWTKLKDHLTGLWDNVLDSVMGWVTGKIVTEGTRILLGFLDISGIMPVINGLVAVYRAIQSFAARLREMLEIVHSFLSGLADIAKGATETASQYLENTMASSLPVLIDFLANQVGLGSLGSKIKEMVEGVRDLVNAGLDKLIDLAINGGKAVLKAIKGGGKKTDEADKREPALDIDKMTPTERKNAARAEIESQLAKGMEGDDLVAALPSISDQFGLDRIEIDKSDPQRPRLRLIASPADEIPLETAAVEPCQASPAGATSKFKFTGYKNVLTPYGAVQAAYGDAAQPDKFAVSEKEWIRPGKVEVEIVGARGKDKDRPALIGTSGKVGKDEWLLATKGKRIAAHDGGHLVALHLAGAETNDTRNLAPQRPSFNRGMYLQVEKLVAASPKTADCNPDFSVPIKMEVEVSYPAGEHKISHSQLMDQGLIAQDTEPVGGPVIVPRRIPDRWSMSLTATRGVLQEKTPSETSKMSKQSLGRQVDPVVNLGSKDYVWWVVGNAPEADKKDIGGDSYLALVAQQEVPDLASGN